MNTFNEIYILDLHGNSLKKETCPDGTKDGNVFDIRQGTSIALFIKQKDKKGCNVFYADQFGLRESKYDWLGSNDFMPNNYKKLTPESPWYFFIPRDTDNIKSYLKWKAIHDIFPVNVTGIVTARDGLVIDFDKNVLRNRIMQFRNLNLPDDTIKEAYHLKDTRGWKLSEARKVLSKDKEWDTYFQKIQYRPFDIREIYYTPTMVDWGRPELMRNILEDNLSLCFMRQFSGDMDYNHFLVSKYMVDNRTFFSSKGIIQQAPLYLYKAKPPKKLQLQSMILFEPETEYKTKSPNIDKALYEKLNNTYKTKPTAEEILHYIYAVFYSNIYREKYSEFLRIDFPKVPFTANYGVFKQMAELGSQLVDLHLIKKGQVLDHPISKFHGEGIDRIEKVVYDEDEQRVYINKDKYFDHVSPEVWNYQIGGYQVLQKYLKDRKGLMMDDSRYYGRIITALSNTIKIQTDIDILYPKIETEIILFEENENN